MQLEDFVTTAEAAEKIGISYQLLMARIRKGKIKAVKKGWGVLIHKDELAKAIKAQKAWEKKQASRKS